MANYECNRCYLPYGTQRQGAAHTREQCDYVLGLLQEVNYYRQYEEKNCSEDYVPPANGVYCGNAPQLPEGYGRFGEPYECMKKGFGVGRCAVFRNARRN